MSKTKNQKGSVLNALETDTNPSTTVFKKLVTELKTQNKLARKRNKLAKHQYRQSVLDYEQAERQYLIEKSHLQPSLRLSASEFLLCEPDFMNDPEQAGEAKFLKDLGYTVDDRILRIQIRAMGEGEFMLPSIILARTKQSDSNENADAMTDSIHFVNVESLSLNPQGGTNAYLVYRDKTSLPVVHKYRLAQRQGSDLRRWDITHRDTIFGTSRNQLSLLARAAGCESLFQE